MFGAGTDAVDFALVGLCRGISGIRVSLVNQFNTIFNNLFTALDKDDNKREKCMGNEKIYAMSFAKIYPLLVAKAEKKGRTVEEVNEIICWLTGYDTKGIENALKGSVSYEEFFQNAPELNPNRKAIKGVVCKVRVEAIEEPLMQEIRYLDKLIDELAKGKTMDKILRK